MNYEINVCVAPDVLCLSDNGRFVSVPTALSDVCQCQLWRQAPPHGHSELQTPTK